MIAENAFVSSLDCRSPASHALVFSLISNSSKFAQTFTSADFYGILTTGVSAFGAAAFGAVTVGVGVDFSCYLGVAVLAGAGLPLPFNVFS